MMATEVDPLAFQKGFQATQSIFDNARQNQLAELAMGQKLQEMKRQNALAVVVGNMANYDEAGNLKRTALPKIAAASPAALPQYQKVISDQATSQAAQQKALRDQLIAQFDWADKNMAGVQNQAQWDEFKARAAQVYPDVASRLPAQFDPTAIQANRMKMIPVVVQWKEEQAQERFRQQQDTTRRGQDLSAETARRGQDMTASTAAAKPAQKEAEAQTQRVKDANDALGLLDQAEKLVPSSTGSYIGAGLDTAAAAFGKSTEGAQSDKDVAMYRQMAGTIGDPTIPRDTKLAAIQTIREIQNKYAGNSVTPAPATPKAAQPDALAELQRRAQSDPALAAKLKAMGY
jgi:hypothetical protein